VRRAFSGALPVPAERADYDWSGVAAPTPSVVDPPVGFVASANRSAARISRIEEVLADPASRSIDGFGRLQHDVLARNAQRLVPLLTRLHSPRADVEAARDTLLRWDKRLAAASSEAVLYVAWEQTLLRNLVALRVPATLVDAFAAMTTATLVPAIIDASPVWFDAPSARSRDSLLLTTLSAAVDERAHTGTQPQSGGPLHAVTFLHPLGITDLARQRYNAGPIEVGGYADTVFSIANLRGGRSVGPAFRAIFDAGDWDRSLAINAPGQAESPNSAHAADHLKPWSAGEYVPLPFGDAAIHAAEESILMLMPK